MDSSKIKLTPKSKTLKHEQFRLRESVRKPRKKKAKMTHEQTRLRKRGGYKHEASRMKSKVKKKRKKISGEMEGTMIPKIGSGGVEIGAFETFTY